MKCKDCKYFDCFHEGVEIGDCRKNPPTINETYNYNAFPRVAYDAWCGEFKLKVQNGLKVQSPYNRYVYILEGVEYKEPL